MSNIGLYIHIPFCLKKCSYCDFFSIRGSDDKYDDYISDLIKNIENYSNILKNRTIDTIYFGGGTPSCIGSDRIIKILGYIYDNCNVSTDAEITVEVNPITGDRIDFSLLKVFGVNRISVGLQSNNDVELRLLSRLHNSSQTEATIDMIKDSGITDFSLDVMLGIPHQNIDSLRETLDFCVKSGANHISTYMLKIEKDTPFYYNRDNLTFADDDTMADMYEFTSSMLKSNGFKHYEISNFCRGDRISRHNMKYWRLDDYLGLGPSAHSMIDKKRFYYPRSFESFKNSETLFDCEAKTEEEYIMLSLRTDTGLIFDEYEAMFGVKLSPTLLDKSRLYAKAGLTRVSDSSITLTEKGFLLSNSIICELLTDRTNNN